MNGESEEMSGIKSAAVASLALALGACSAARQTSAQAVPANAPDSLPSTFIQEAALVVNSYGDRISTRFLQVYFRQDSSLQEREEAIRGVSGTVVGGVSFGPDGIYVVAVPGDSTIATIDSIAAVLESFPQVGSAFPYSFIALGH